MAIAVTIQIKDKGYAKRLDKLGRNHFKVIDKEIMQDIAIDALKETRRRMSGPVLKVRTGRLRRSVSIERRGARTTGKLRYTLLSDVFYAIFHETGTRFMRARRIWGPVVRWANDRLNRRIKRRYTKLLRTGE